MKPLCQRFEQKVRRGLPHECHIWTASCTEDGYGIIFNQGKVLRAHRVAWELANGKIPSQLHVLHRCDNPPCVNILHLWLGTNADNVHDKESKGRGGQPRGINSTMGRYPELVRGSRNPNAILGENDVAEIRRMYSTGRYTQKFIGDVFGTKASNVYAIVNRRAWKHIP